jgi:hypothetical protein
VASSKRLVRWRMVAGRCIGTWLYGATFPER